ncbi:MAG: hypothetical protein PHF11_03605 [Candidatus Omnitrophica bacterium]|nr:hypothetical protein [Candidatus Omnitrophota bacterium]
MRVEELKGKLALFKFSEEIRPDLSLFQIYKDEIWAIVTGIDDVGVWIENPAYELGVWWDDKGNLIPQHKQVKEKIRANILIAWRYIKAIMDVEDERFKKVKSERLPGFQAYK